MPAPHSQDLEDDLNELFQPIKSGNPSRPLLTFLKSRYHFFTHSIAIADRKANIMVRLNSLIISGMVIFFKVWSAFSNLEVAMLSVLIIASLTSLWFAALAAQPTSLKRIFDTNKSGKAANHLFDFKRINHLSYESYNIGFDEMMKEERLIIGNMARDLFQLSKNMSHKYSLLRNSYRVFLWGLGITVVLLLISIFAKV